jgi:hypothetical protein
LYAYLSFSPFTQQVTTCLYGYVLHRSDITGTFLFVGVPYLYVIASAGAGSMVIRGKTVFIYLFYLFRPAAVILSPCYVTTNYGVINEY